MSLTINKSTLLTLISVVFYKILVDYIYEFYVSFHFGYAGFNIDFSYIKYIESWIVISVIFILFQRKSLPKSIGIMLFFVYIFLLIPLSTLYAFKNELSIYYYSMIVGFVIIILIINNINISIKYLQHGRLFFLFFFLLILMLISVNFYLKGGISFFNLNPLNVYEYRLDINETIYSGIFGYINNWFTKVLNIAAIALALKNRYYFLTMILIVLQIIIFGFTSHKLVLFAPFLIMMLFFIAKVENKQMVITNLISFALIIVIISTYLLEDNFISSIILRRALFVPADLNFTYYHFFSENEYVYLSDSIFNSFIKYPYDVPSAFVIGGYLGKPGMSANTGFLATSFMHFGYIGVMIFSAIVGFIFTVINNLSRNLPDWLVQSIVFIPILSMMFTSKLFTALLTHGLGISILTLWFISSKNTTFSLKGYKFEI